jgi:hypothetical protein
MREVDWGESCDVVVSTNADSFQLALWLWVDAPEAQSLLDHTIEAVYSNDEVPWQSRKHEPIISKRDTVLFLLALGLRSHSQGIVMLSHPRSLIYIQLHAQEYRLVSVAARQP